MAACRAKQWLASAYRDGAGAGTPAASEVMIAAADDAGTTAASSNPSIRDDNRPDQGRLTGGPFRSRGPYSAGLTRSVVGLPAERCEEVDDAAVGVAHLRVPLPPEGVPGLLVALSAGSGELLVEAVHLLRGLTAKRQSYPVTSGWPRPR